MSIKDALKSGLGVLGVEITSDNTPAPAKSTRKQNASVLPTTHPLSSVSDASTPVTSSLTNEEMDKFAQHFEGLLKGANLPGPDYYEFTRVMDTLAGPIKDEATRIAAAFQSLAVQGLTKEKLFSSAQQYIDIIEKDREGFQAAVDSKAQEEITARKQRLADLEKDIKNASDQINQLTAVIAKSKNESSQLQTEITETETKIKRNESAYQAACDAVINKIKMDIEKATSKL